MYCPECKDEFRPGVTRCVKCDEDLVSELPVIEEPETDGEYAVIESADMVFLANVDAGFEATMKIALLESNGITVHKRHKGGGEYLFVSMGFSVSGVDLYVPRELLEDARELLLQPHELPDEFYIEDVPFYTTGRAIKWWVLILLLPNLTFIVWLLLRFLDII